MTEQDRRELMEALFWPVRAWACVMVMAIDYCLALRRHQRGEGRPMTKDEHKKRFEVN